VVSVLGQLQGRAPSTMPCMGSPLGWLVFTKPHPPKERALPPFSNLQSLLTLTSKFSVDKKIEWEAG
jgi:hypothetical protein